MKYKIFIFMPIAFLLLMFPRDGETNQKGRTVKIYSDSYHIDRVYKSMQGPTSRKKFKLTKADVPGKMWITGFRTKVVDANSADPISQEFMCHLNLDFESQKHRDIFQWDKNVSNRMFTLSQGQFEVILPQGFGIPVSTYEFFDLSTQVLNHNIENPDVNVKYEVFIDFIHEKDLEVPLKPLFPSNAYIVALLEGKDGYYGVEDQPKWMQRKAHAHRGEHAPGIKSSPLKDGQGRKFSGHWIVKPGTETRRALVTKMLKIPFDTTIHYIAVHLHPFAKSIELRDLTLNKTVWKSMVEDPEVGIGIKNVDYYSSTEGLPVYKDHEYEMVSVYNNTSGVDQDAMATMFFYLADHEEMNKNQ